MCQWRHYVKNEAIPRRVQLRRSKGWRMPPNTVKVDRTTRYGNPYQAGQDGDGDRAHLVALYRDYLARPEQADLVAHIRTSLAGNTNCVSSTTGRRLYISGINSAEFLYANPVPSKSV